MPQCKQLVYSIWYQKPTKLIYMINLVPFPLFCEILCMYRFIIMFISNFMMDKTQMWRTFWKCKIEHNYCFTFISLESRNVLTLRFYPIKTNTKKTQLVCTKANTIPYEYTKWIIKSTRRSIMKLKYPIG